MKSNEHLAVIDCGTNTFHLLIGETNGKKHRFLHRSKRAVKIGTRSDPFTPIPEIALERAFKALSSFRQIIDEFRAKKIIATGTAALRDSTNGKEFLKTVKRDLEIDIQLIPGELEAELIFEGARQAVKMDTGCSLIMDIGGGSTEFILCNANTIFWKKSFRLGAARLLAWWNPGDPPDRKEIDLLEIFLLKELQDLVRECENFNPNLLIGASGSFETVAAMMYRGSGLNIPRGNDVEIPVDTFHSIHQELTSSSQAQRLKMPGMLRMRAEMMVPASVLISFVIRNTGIRKLKLSRYALKEGLFFVSAGTGSRLDLQVTHSTLKH